MKRAKIPLTSRTVKICKDFADERNRKNADYNDDVDNYQAILYGALAETFVSKYLNSINITCSSPDFKIYTTKEKIQMGHPADLNCSLGDIHVKSCIKPWSLEDSSWCYKHNVHYTEEQLEDLHAYVNINVWGDVYVLDIVGFYKGKDIVPLWSPPRSPKYRKTKKCIYYNDIANIPSEINV